jgi:hypothetical protein
MKGIDSGTAPPSLENAKTPSAGRGGTSGIASVRCGAAGSGVFVATSRIAAEQLGAVILVDISGEC